MLQYPFWSRGGGRGDDVSMAPAGADRFSHRDLSAQAAGISSLSLLLILILAAAAFARQGAAPLSRTLNTNPCLRWRR